MSFQQQRGEIEPMKPIMDISRTPSPRKKSGPNRYNKQSKGFIKLKQARKPQDTVSVFFRKNNATLNDFVQGGAEEMIASKKQYLHYVNQSPIIRSSSHQMYSFPQGLRPITQTTPQPNCQLAYYAGP